MNYIQQTKNLLSTKINVENELLDLYVLLVFTTGKNTTWENVHDAWSVWRTNTFAEHKSIIRFSELTPEIQEMDKEYTDAIIETARELYK